MNRSNEISPANVFAAETEPPGRALIEKYVADSIEKFFTSARINEIIDQALQTAAKGRAAKSYRLAMKVKGRILFLELAEVAAIEARGNYVLLQRQSGSSMLRASISDLERRLAPCGFIRIHRSVLVNCSWIQEIRPWRQREYAVRMRGGKEYTLSRSYKENLKSIAQLWIGTGAFFSE